MGVGIREIEAAQPVPETPAGLLVSQVDGMYALSVSPHIAGPRGVFYTTARPIEDPRLIVIPAVAIPTEEDPNPPAPTQPTALALWHERLADGELIGCRAIRLGGRAGLDGTWHDGDVDEDSVFDAGFVCIGEIDYRIMLRYAPFDPVGLPGQQGRPGIGEPALAEGLRAADVPGGCHIYIVQFWTQSLEEFRTAVREAGGAIHGFMPLNSYLVEMNDAAAAAVGLLPHVRAVTPYHPAYRTDPALRARLLGPGGPPPGTPATARYNIVVHQRGSAQKRAVALRIEALGGVVEERFPDGYRLSATLTPEQLAGVLRMDEVEFVDEWAAPGEDMAIARIIGGANSIESTLGFKGEGVRGEVMDASIDLSHDAFGLAVIQHGDLPPNPTGGHGTSTYGIAFGQPPAGQPAGARGMLPGAGRGGDTVGGGIFASYTRLATVSRYDHTAELVGFGSIPTNLRAVFQSNSWGNGHTLDYATFTKELDDIAFQMDILICQSQGNLGTTFSRPQAWAKNVVSVGALKHYDNTDPADDCWFSDCEEYSCVRPVVINSSACSDPLLDNTCGVMASRGPAADGRVKPDLCGFFDRVQTADFRPQCTIESLRHNRYTIGNLFGNSTDFFGGTSAATPIVAGHFGLFFQMWHAGVFPGFGGGADVFASRPHMTTAKAMLINSARPYAFSGTGDDRTRTIQGWGQPNLDDALGTGLYDLRNDMLVINETDDLTTPGQSISYVVVSDGTKPLRATLVYADPAGTTSSSQHRINDLSLKLTVPTGTTFYWGNNGLLTGNWSTPGGSENKIDTVENVFIQSPAAGAWTVTVILSELNADGNPETPATDADYALVVSGMVPPGGAMRGDWNADGKRDATDLEEFLVAFVAGKADVDDDGRTSSADLYTFLDVMLGGQP